MKKGVYILLILLTGLLVSPAIYSQCSICTRTAQQLGEKPAQGLNAGIIYLAITPFLIAGYVYYRWTRMEKTK